MKTSESGLKFNLFYKVLVKLQTPPIVIRNTVGEKLLQQCKV